tara:strand:- start:188 stop:760 length:573 start_codon:yes stop_codon:yes gene_type:complete
MSKTTIPTGGITDGTIATGDIADDAVTAAKSTAHITVADHYIVTAAFAGDADPVSSNISRASAADSVFGNIGSAMSVSSGVFTFPSTGIYLVDARAVGFGNAGQGRADMRINVTTDNSNYVIRATTQIGPMDNFTNGMYCSGSCSAIIDVTNTTNTKVSFSTFQTNDSNQLLADSEASTMSFTFVRLGDT